MKAPLIFLCACLLFSTLGRTQSASIQGRLQHLNQEIPYIYYSYTLDDHSISDSTRVSDNQYFFDIKGDLQGRALPVFLTLRSRPFGDHTGSRKTVEQTIIIQPGSNKILSTDSFANLTTPGSFINNEYQQLEKQRTAYFEKQDTVFIAQRAARQKKDTEKMYQLQWVADSLNTEAAKIYETYANRHPESPLALYTLINSISIAIDPGITEPIFNKLSAKARNSVAGKEFHSRILNAKKVAPGAMAPSFSLTNQDGVPVSLEAFKGKYVLLDFWASWCIPCRAQNPSLKTIFNQYRDKNFTIISISLDRNSQKENWINAIKQDQLTWTQLCGLFNNLEDNAVAASYDVKIIPQNFFIDPDGKIIARNLDSRELAARIKDLLK